MQDFDSLLALRDLTVVGRDWLHTVTISPATADELSWYLNAKGQFAKVLRGRKMRTVNDLFDEYAAALQFPSYFGENWAALHECMTDLSWLQAPSYVLIITDASKFLADEGVQEIHRFISVSKSIVETWSIANHPGSTWSHNELPFHFVLQETPRDTETLKFRLAAIDVPIMRLDKQ